MKRLDAEIIDFYNTDIVKMIIEKYGYSAMEAFKRFVYSKTHEMLENPDCGFTSYGAGGVFDIWEAEMVTGDPKKSVYIRGE